MIIINIVKKKNPSKFEIRALSDFYFINSRNWSCYFEVNKTKENIKQRKHQKHTLIIFIKNITQNTIN